MSTPSFIPILILSLTPRATLATCALTESPWLVKLQATPWLQTAAKSLSKMRWMSV